MGKIFITCPECGQQLSFEEVPGYQNMVVECPKCHFKATANVYKGGKQARGAYGADEMPTQLIIPPKTVADIGQIRVKDTNEIQFLKEGKNIIGRRAKTGTADIKISTDMYMSRQHVLIDVVKKGNGYEHHLVEINSKNIVKLNGKPINRGDILILKFGDSMILGTTEIILEGNDEDATKLV
ncbi:MAG: FHA domain-containing protein [Muribaculaceae bacterium]|nr:FHA domain-containing protein [Muribaculaceae bacterium]